VTGPALTHETFTSVTAALAAEYDAGTNVALKVIVSCSSACQLLGSPVRILTPDGLVVKEVELTTFDGVVNETNELSVRAPLEPGEHTWTALFPARESEGLLHGASSAPFSFVVKPHAVSMTVWGIPSPVVAGQRFSMKIGARCTAECTLAGQPVEVYDQAGESIATGTLGDIPWPDTRALYWADGELVAPPAGSLLRCTARFARPNLEFEHSEAERAFGFRIGNPPEHVLTVEVLDQDTGVPLGNSQVVAHPYRGITGGDGVTKLNVPAGKYQIYVSRNGYKIVRTEVEVAGATDVQVTLAALPHDANQEG